MEPKQRQKRIIQTSILGIAVNLLFASIKVIIGLAASSLAIVSEGINNASDAITSLLTLAGAKLSSRHADAKHPFGYGRIEYLASLAVSMLILYTGIELLRESIDGILHPAAMEVSGMMVGIVAFTALGKLVLGMYTIRQGIQTESSALEAVGRDCRNDAVFSVITIAVTLIYLFSGVSLDAYAGVLFAAVILKAGYETLKETLDELLGRPGKEELARLLYKEIRSTEGVLGAADMMLHNYGPDAWSGSVNIEVDHEKTVGEIYGVIHALQLKIMHEHHVTMVFGIYAVDNDHDDVKELRRRINAFVRKQEHVKSTHALYIEPGTGKLYCDLIVDYDLRDWGKLRDDFYREMADFSPRENIELTIETEFV